jgi:transporter family-2 protein
MLILAFLIGGVVALQGRVVGSLTNATHNGISAGFASNLVGWLALWIIVFGFKSERESFKRVLAALKDGRLKFWEILGGIGGGVFVTVQSSNVPVVGVAIFTISYVAGQTVSSLLVDKIGIAHSGKKAVTLSRVMTSIFTMIGVFVAVYPDLKHSTFKALPITIIIFTAFFTSFQQAINSRLNAVSLRPFVTSWFNFASGTVLVTIVLIINLSTGSHFGQLPTAPHEWWKYLGAPLGIVFIATTAHIIKHLGVLKAVLFGVAGQLIGALLLDWLAPTHKGAINGYLITGTAITLTTIIITSLLGNKSKTR